MLVESQGSSSSEGNESTHAADKGAADGGQDVSHLFRQSQAELARANATLQSQGRDLEGLKSKAATLDRMAEVFNPKTSEDAGDPREAEINDLIDYYLKQGMEAERRGHAIPLTVHNAVRGLQAELEMHRHKKESDAKLARALEEIKALKDPSREVNNRAYSRIDNTIINYLTQLYGHDEAYEPVKQEQYNAISRLIGKEIRSLQERSPHVWDQIARDEAKQQKMAKYFVEKALPPKVKQMLEHDQIQRTPMTQNELMQAFHEADQQFKDDPKQRMKIKQQIREQILEQMWLAPKQMKQQQGRPSFGKLYGAG
jgi:hypothetical protein